MIKTDPERVNTILNIALQISASLSIVSEPVLPFTAAKIFDQFGMNNINWEAAGSADLLPANTVVKEAGLLFEKIEDSVIEKQVQKLHDAKRLNELESKKVTEAKPEIQFEDFSKMDIRIAQILEAKWFRRARSY